MQIVILLVVIFLLIMCMSQNKKEGYSTISVGNTYGRTDPYYIWRTYNHDPYNFHQYGNTEYDYPYNYKPKPYTARYMKYLPYFHHYGYGHL